MQFVCEVCTYPSGPRAPDHCDNPACVANPAVTETQKAAWRASYAKRQAEEAERQRVRDIRRRRVALGHG